MLWKALLCKIFLARSRYKLSVVKRACGSSMHTQKAFVPGWYRLITVLTCKRLCYYADTSDLESRGLVREREAREKLGASESGRANIRDWAGLVGVCVDDSRRGFEHWEDATRQ